MKSGANDLPDPSVCSCFPSSPYLSACNKMKWSTLSIGIALLIIIVYLSSGLYTLIDVTTIVSTQTNDNRHEMALWPITSASWITILGWVSVSVYFAVVLLITFLLCGIQLNKPWLLLFWSITMILMLLTDGIVTVLSLREYQQQNYRPTQQVKILFIVMTIRLTVSFAGIFVTLFHFRRLNKAQLEEKNRRRMLDRYNASSPSPSYHESWARPNSMPNPSTDDLSPPIPLPRAKVATVQYHPTSTMFHKYNSQSEFIDQTHQRPISRYNEDFRYNIPLHERFHQHQINGVQQF